MSRGKDFNKGGLRLRKGFYILLKILFSFRSEAYYVLWLKFLQLLFTPFDYLFYAFERLIKKKNEKSKIHDEILKKLKMCKKIKINYKILT